MSFTPFARAVATAASSFVQVNWSWTVSIADQVVWLSQRRMDPTGTVGQTPSCRLNTCIPNRVRCTVVPVRS